MHRICADCARLLPRTSYTTNQNSKGAGVSRYANCVHRHHSDPPASRTLPDAGRHSLSNRAIVSQYGLDNPFAEGAFRWVCKGTFTSGQQQGEACVLKQFKTGSVFSDDYFTRDIKAVNKALEFVNRFNQLGVINKHVEINVTEVWTLHNEYDEKEKVLIEPFIENYQKFNSNSGWNDDSEAWGEVMQALSHFSYHVSGGYYVLCDLQGGLYQHEVVLSDPVILSRSREFGVTDIDPKGISSFFNQHDCNHYCRPHWTKPARPVPHFRPVPGTTMFRRQVPTARSRAMGTRMF